ncbi:TetR family transcriptional regulator [Nocardia mangyaensis]|uniref:TetR family transcriptional regulator n=1 Tax=Nocardia mangyaensis TaxID=2213200 RepID=A0A1J0VTH3_9NOCA|nr:TetR/AcrR family transcriptional regulator [Nocardia mangyaensis]APE35231.1 TetR family transcriptional regulator [Nocardia mangyaensis]
MSLHTPYHHGDLRAALLTRAEATLREVGVDGLSLRQLARDTGVSHAAPSRHFRDKQALLDALAVTGFERLGDRFEQAVTQGPITKRLQTVARAYLRFAVDNPELLPLMFVRRHDSTADDIQQVVDRAFAVPIALIAEGQAAGEIVPGDPKRLGLTALAALQGLATFIGSGYTADYDSEQLLDDLVGHLTLGLLPR